METRHGSRLDGEGVKVRGARHFVQRGVERNDLGRHHTSQPHPRRSVTRTLFVTLAVVVAAAGRLVAQTAAPLPMLRSVADAEAEGRAFPRGPAGVDSLRAPI